MLFKNRPANQYQPWEQRLPVMCFKGYRGDFGEGGSAEQENKTIVMKALKHSGLQDSWSLFVACRHGEMISLCQTIVMSEHVVRWKRVKWNLKQKYTSWFPHLSLWDIWRWKLCLQSPQVVWHEESPPGHVRPCDMDRELVQVPFVSYSRAPSSITPTSCTGTLHPSCGGWHNRKGLISCSLGRGSAGWKGARAVLQMRGIKVLWRGSLRGNGRV